MGGDLLGVGVEGVEVPEHQKAYAVWAERLGEAQPSKLRSLRVSEVSTRVWKLLDEVGKEDVVGKLEKIPAELFRAEQVGELEELARVGVHVRANQLKAKALEKGTQTATKLPKALVAAVGGLRKRMCKVVAYHLGDMAHVRRLLAEIRAHRRHRDWASDLDTLCGLYRAYAEVLQKDTVRYRAEDVQEAFALTFQMRATRLGRPQSSPSAYWDDQGQRLITVARAIYDDVLKTARWVMRDLPESELDKRFPPLFAGQGGRPRKPKPPREPKPKRQPPPDQAAEMPETPDNTPPD